MQAQHVAEQSSSTLRFEASRSQPDRLHGCGYLSGPDSPIVHARITQVNLTSRGLISRHCGAGSEHICDRRLRCPRASNCLPYSELLSQHPHAREKHRLKSLSWLTPRRSLSSRHIQASTSKLVWGQASAPVPTPPTTRSRRASWR